MDLIKQYRKENFTHGIDKINKFESILKQIKKLDAKIETINKLSCSV